MPGVTARPQRLWLATLGLPTETWRRIVGLLRILIQLVGTHNRARLTSPVRRQPEIRNRRSSRSWRRRLHRRSSLRHRCRSAPTYCVPARRSRRCTRMSVSTVALRRRRPGPGMSDRGRRSRSSSGRHEGSRPGWSCRWGMSLCSCRTVEPTVSPPGRSGSVREGAKAWPAVSPLWASRSSRW